MKVVFLISFNKRKYIILLRIWYMNIHFHSFDDKPYKKCPYYFIYPESFNSKTFYHFRDKVGQIKYNNTYKVFYFLLIIQKYSFSCHARLIFLKKTTLDVICKICYFSIKKTWFISRKKLVALFIFFS